MKINEMNQQISNTTRCEECGAEMDRYPIYDGQLVTNHEYKICAACAAKLPDPSADAWAEIMKGA